ncbi:hypothetical protein [Alkalicoccobacillus gibsonii]|uniref:hypothetical protein n=1 Tax=Alkalicoccobacillus gibsonii TaxID=79881 RepID=UPI00351559DD
MHTLTTTVTKATVTYNTNHKTVQDALVQGQTDMKAQVNVEALQLLEVLARLRAGGI